MKKSLFVATVLVSSIFLSLHLFAEQEKPKSDLFVDQPNTIISESHQMTFMGPRSGEGYFSADGKKMIFQSEREPSNPFYQMYIYNFENGEVNRVSPGQGKTTCGWIHPNKKKIMWSSTHKDPKVKAKVKAEYEERAKPVKGRYSWSFDENFDIFESDLNGKKLKQLTKEKGYDAEGSYSPDGQYIAFASNRLAYSQKLNADDQKMFEKDPSYFMDIYLMKADGTEVRQLTNVAGYDGGPFFSADGKKITWRRFSQSGATAEIYTMNVDGTDQKQVTQLGSMSWAPYFDPSGDYIIFASSVLGYSNFELFIVDSAGKHKPVRVTFSEGFDGLASFDPVSAQVTWSHRNEKGESQIYLAKWDDAQARKLLDLPPRAQSLQTPLKAKAAPASPAYAMDMVKYLASEEFKGRATGSPEELIYTQHLATEFQKFGLKPAVGGSFIQEFDFISGVEAKGENKANFSGRYTKELERGKDFQIISYTKVGQFNSAPMAFVGYGIRAPATPEMPAFDSYKDSDVQGKWVILLDESPKPSSTEFKKHVQILAVARLQHKITVARNLGAYGVIVIHEGKMGDLKFEGSLSESQIPVLKISIDTFESVLKKSDHASTYSSYKKLKEKYETFENVPGFQLSSQYFAATINLEFKKSIGRNVLGRLDPASKTLAKNKALLIGAHGDHLGLGLAGNSLATGDLKGKIHYGADDNASGVAGVLELAKYFSNPELQKNLKKPIYFAIWSGEEIGVLGSNHFVKQWKNFDKSFEAGLNMDMIGRVREQKLFVQGLGSAPEWTQIIEKVASQTDLSLQASTDPYLPTDAMAIYLGNIPSISFFTGAHAEYHTPKDKPDTLNYRGLMDVVATVKGFAQEIATNPKQVVTYAKVEGNSGQRMEGRGFRIYLGTIPDYSQEGIQGVRISGASKNSPAEKAGLVAGDVIVEFDSTKIENIYDYVYTLQAVKPDIKTKIKVLRSSKTLEFEITPAIKE